MPLLQPVPLPVINGPGGADLGADAALAAFQHGTEVRVNGGNLGHCLGKGDVNGPAGVQAQVKGVGRLLLGALFRAQAAAGAFGLVHIPGLMPDGHREVSHKALHRLHLGVGHDLNPLMLGRIHHFGGQDAGCTVQGGKGLVNLGHFPPNGRLFLHQIYLKSGLSNVQGRLDAGDASANDQGPLGHGTLPGRQGCVQLDLGNGRPAQNHRLFRGLFFALMNPGALLPDIGNFQHVRVQAGPADCLAKCGFMHPGGAGANHHTGKAVLPDGLHDQVLSGLGTHIRILCGVDNPRFFSKGLRHLDHIHGGGNVGAAPADKNTNSFHRRPPHFPYFRRALTKACWGISLSNMAGIWSGSR